jgi:uncharacterized membrane protein YkgB
MNPKGTMKLSVNRTGTTLQTAGGLLLRYSLVVFLCLFGALKWTMAEARGVEPFIVHSPMLAWSHQLFGMRGASEFVGVVELMLGALIALRPWNPKLSSWGSIAACVMFLVTLSFLFTTPNVENDAPFLLKDLCLLGAALWTAGEAIDADHASAGVSRG